METWNTIFKEVLLCCFIVFVFTYYYFWFTGRGAQHQPAGSPSPEPESRFSWGKPWDPIQTRGSTAKQSSHWFTSRMASYGEHTVPRWHLPVSLGGSGEALARLPHAKDKFPGSATPGAASAKEPAGALQPSKIQLCGLETSRTGSLNIWCYFHGTWHSSRIVQMVHSCSQNYVTAFCI